MSRKKSILEKPTNDLEKELEGKMELAHFLKENERTFISSSIADLLDEIIKEKDISKAELARKAQMSDIYLFQILNGRRHPSRDRLICICLGLECSLEKTRELLKKCRYTDLYAKDRRDAIIMFGIEHGWGISQINEALFEAAEKPLV